MAVASSQMQTLEPQAAQDISTPADIEHERLELLQKLGQLEAQLEKETLARVRAEKSTGDVKRLFGSRILVIQQDNIRLRKQIDDNTAEADSRCLKQQRQLRNLYRSKKYLEAENLQVRHCNEQYDKEKQGLWKQLEAQKAENSKLQALLEEELVAAAASANADSEAAIADSRVRAVRAQLTLAQRAWDFDRQKLSEAFQLAVQQLETSRVRVTQVELMAQHWKNQAEALMSSGSSGSSGNGRDDSSSSSSCSSTGNNDNGNSGLSSSSCSSGSSCSSDSSCSYAPAHTEPITYPYDVVAQFYHGDGRHVICELDKVKAVPMLSPFLMVQSLGSDQNDQQEQPTHSEIAARVPRRRHRNKQRRALPEREADVSHPASAAIVHQPAPAAVVHQPTLAAVVHQPAPAAVVHQPAPAADVPPLVPAVAVHPPTLAANLTPQKQGVEAWSDSWQGLGCWHGAGFWPGQ